MFRYLKVDRSCCDDKNNKSDNFLRHRHSFIFPCVKAADRGRGSKPDRCRDGLYAGRTIGLAFLDVHVRDVYGMARGTAANEYSFVPSKSEYTD